MISNTLGLKNLRYFFNTIEIERSHSFPYYTLFNLRQELTNFYYFFIVCYYLFSKKNDIYIERQNHYCVRIVGQAFPKLY